MVTITYSGGRKEETADTIEAAKDVIRATWPQAFFCDNDERILAWASEAACEDNDSAAVVASIYRA